MKIIIVLCLIAMALARPQVRQEDLEATVLRDERTVGEDPAVFKHGYGLSNGIEFDKEGYAGEKGQSNMRGTYIIPFGDGLVGVYEYVADEQGFKIISSKLSRS